MRQSALPSFLSAQRIASHRPATITGIQPYVDESLPEPILRDRMTDAQWFGRSFNIALRQHLITFSLGLVAFPSATSHSRYDETPSPLMAPRQIVINRAEKSPKHSVVPSFSSEASQKAFEQTRLQQSAPEQLTGRICFCAHGAVRMLPMKGRKPAQSWRARNRRAVNFMVYRASGLARPA